MSTRYDRAEDAIKARLLTDDAAGNPSPFREDRILTYGAQLTDAELIEEVENLQRQAPAAIVYLLGGSFELDGGVCDERAQFAVIVIGASTSKTAALRSEVGVYALLDFARKQLHQYRDSGGELLNELELASTRRITQPDRPATVAAMMLVVETRIDHDAS